MSAPLLATKLFVPPPGNILVERPRLVKKLYECLHPACRLALISAPAGFGKTTLVSTWAIGLESSELSPCPSFSWLSLDDGDNDPVIFWSYVISSLQTQQEEIGQQALSLLQSNSGALQSGADCTRLLACAWLFNVRKGIDECLGASDGAKNPIFNDDSARSAWCLSIARPWMWLT